MNKNIEENISLEDLIKSSRKISGLDIIKDKISSKIIYKDIKTLIDTIKTYKDVCLELGEKEYTIYDFLSIPEEFRIKVFNTIRLKQIAKLFNQDQKNWYPYFTVGIGGLVFNFSYCDCSSFIGPTGYFKDQETSNFIGNNFKEIYRDLY